MNRETVDAKSLLLFLESKNLLHILESMRVQMEKTIERTKIFQQEKRNINISLSIFPQVQHLNIEDKSRRWHLSPCLCLIFISDFMPHLHCTLWFEFENMTLSLCLNHSTFLMSITRNISLKHQQIQLGTLYRLCCGLW